MRPTTAASFGPTKHPYNGTQAPFGSVQTNTFNVRATGGIYLYTSVNPDGSPNGGVYVPPGSGTLMSVSDRNAKENFEPVDGKSILEKVAALPVATWNYKTQNKAIRHLGPVAQDFNAAFGVGDDERHIASLDEDGVALAAIQGL